MTSAAVPPTGPLVPRPANTPEALRQALAIVAPDRLDEMAASKDEAFAQAVEQQSVTPVKAWVLTWARDIEIARRPDLAARYHHATSHLEDEDPDTARKALEELTAVLDEALAEVRQ
ncbi:hypothetical protein [Streptomyces sp. NPDC042319]|uniref:hypothetical protein n=1 Tax=Streptomyces sp. NPDC042319 TaxID=3154332 RepID=UPI0033D5BA7D